MLQIRSFTLTVSSLHRCRVFYHCLKRDKTRRQFNSKLEKTNIFFLSIFCFFPLFLLSSSGDWSLSQLPYGEMQGIVKGIGQVTMCHRANTYIEAAIQTHTDSHLWPILNHQLTWTYLSLDCRRTMEVHIRGWTCKHTKTPQPGFTDIQCLPVFKSLWLKHGSTLAHNSKITMLYNNYIIITVFYYRLNCPKCVNYSASKINLIM